MSQFDLWQEQFARLKSRERGLIWAASSGLLAWLGLFFAVLPELEQQQQIQRQLQQNQQQVQQLDQQLALVNQQLQQDVNTQILLEIADKEAMQQHLVDRIRQLTGRYVSPEQMTQLLADVLLKDPQVQLVSMRTKVPEPLQIPGATSTDFQLFRHGTVLEFSGNYQQLQQLLSGLEHLSWQLHWRQMTLKVSEYPLSTLQLELETVSEQADYLRI